MVYFSEMRLLSRYIASDAIPAILLGLLFYSSIFLIKSFFEVAELSLRHGIPFFKALFIVFLGFPSVLSITIPMAVLYGVLLSVARMQGQNEMLAFYALGISRVRIFFPFLATIVGFAAMNFIITAFLLPAGNSRLVQYRLELLQSSITRSIQPKTFVDSFPGKVIYINSASEDKRTWSDVFIADHSNPAVQQYVGARRGELYLSIRGDQIWLKLFDSETLALAEGQKYEINRASEQDMLLYPPYTEATITYQKGFREKTFGELRKDMTNQDARTARMADVEYQKRWAIPVTTLVFGLLAFVLAGRQRGKGATRSSVFIFSLFIIFSDYILLTLGENYGDLGKIPPVPAMWIPPFLFLLFALWLSIRPPAQERKSAGLASVLRALRPDFSPGAALSRFFPFLVDGYLLRIWIPYLVLCMTTIIVLFVGVDFSQLSDDVQRHHIGAQTVLIYYLFALPQIIYDFILPLAVLVATALTLSTLERNRELSAMKSLGISWQRIGHTFLITLLGLGSVLFFFGERYLTFSNRKMMEVQQTIRGKPPSIAHAGRLASQDLYLAGSEGWIYGYSGYDIRLQELLGVHAFQFGPDYHLQRHLFAPEAQWAAGRWVVRTGWQRTFAGEGMEQYQELRNAVFPIPDNADVFAQVLDEPRLMNVFQLASYISNLKRIGYDPVEWDVRLWQKIFYPWFLTLLVLAALIATLSGISAGHVWTGMGKSLILGLTLWTGVVIFGKLGDLAVLPPVVAAASPLLVFTLAGLYVFWGLRS